MTLKLDFEKTEFQNKDIFLISLENEAIYRIKKKKKSHFLPTTILTCQSIRISRNWARHHFLACGLYFLRFLKKKEKEKERLNFDFL